MAGKAVSMPFHLAVTCQRKCPIGVRVGDVVDWWLVADPGVRDSLCTFDFEGCPGSLPGQGNPLPKGLAYNAEWLLEPMIFLYRREVQQSGDGQLELTPTVVLADNSICFGIDAAMLASKFGMSTDELFEDNRAHRLIIDSMEDYPDTTRLGFRVGNKQTVLTLLFGQQWYSVNRYA
jgi:hypothetical protein